LRDLPPGMYAVVEATEKIPRGVVFCLRTKNPDPNVKPSNLNPTAPYYLLYVQHGVAPCGIRAGQNGQDKPFADGSDQSNDQSSDNSANGAFALFGNDLDALGSSQGLFNSANNGNGVDTTIEDAGTGQAATAVATAKPIVKLGFAQAKGVLALLRELCAGKTAPDEALCEAFAAATQDGHDMSLVNELVKCAVEACGDGLKQKTLSSLTQRGGTLISGGSKSQTSDFELVTWFVIS